MSTERERYLTPPPTDRDELLRPRDVAARYGPALSEAVLKGMRANGHGPQWFRSGPKAVVYRRSVVEAWISQQEAVAS